MAAFEALTVFLILYFIPGRAGSVTPVAAREATFAEAPTTGAKI